MSFVPYAVYVKVGDSVDSFDFYVGRVHVRELS